MLDIGLGESVGIAVVALIVLGPEKLPRYAADAARMLRQVRKMANDAREEVTRELGPELQDLDLSDFNPRTLVKKHLLEPIDIDELDEDRTLNKPAAGRAPGEAPRQATPGTPPPRYDEDVT